MPNFSIQKAKILKTREDKSDFTRDWYLKLQQQNIDF